MLIIVQSTYVLKMQCATGEYAMVNYGTITLLQM